MSTQATLEQSDYVSLHTLAVSFNADAIDMRDYKSIQIEVWWTTTGSPVGTLELQSSVTGSRWDTEGTAVSIADKTSLFFKLSGTHEARYLRLVYTRESGGTGAVLSAAIIRKGAV